MPATADDAAYTAAVRELFARQPNRMIPDLDRITALCDVLGNPQHAYPVIHLTGTTYFTVAALLGLAFFTFGISCAVSRTRTDARKLFFASIVYLPVLLGVMMWDKV